MRILICHLLKDLKLQKLDLKIFEKLNKDYKKLQL